MSRENKTQRFNRRGFIGATSAAVALGLAGCVGNGGEEDDSPLGEGNGNGNGNGGDTPEGEFLHVTQQVSPLEWDPIVINDVYSNQIANMMYDGLYQYDAGLELEPKIAASEPEVENDGTRFIFPLREEAMFQNGDPVTAEDVEHTFLAPVEESTQNRAEVDMISDTEIIDEHTLQVDLEFPFGPFATTTVVRNVVPKDVRLDDPDAFNSNSPVGSGPFQFVDWTEGEFVELERWDDYWDDDLELANIAEIRYEPVEEDTTRVTRLETQETDVIMGIPAQLYESVEGISHARIEEIQSISYFYVAFNTNEGPTATREVREAVEHSIDMSGFIQQQVEPAGSHVVSPVPTAIAEEWDFPLDRWADMELEQDLDRAQELLDEHAPDDWQPTIIVPPDDLRERLGEVIASSLNDLGYDAGVQRLDWGQFTETYQSGDSDEFQMYALGWSGAGDPDAFIYNLFHESVAGEGGTQGHFYDNPSFHDNITAARQSADFDERRELYIEVIDEILEEKIHMPAYGLMNSMGVNDRVGDLPAHPVSSENPRVISTYNNTTVE